MLAADRWSTVGGRGVFVTRRLSRLHSSGGISDFLLSGLAMMTAPLLLFLCHFGETVAFPSDAFRIHAENLFRFPQFCFRLTAF